MNDFDQNGKEEIYSRVLRAGRRTYFLDVRATKADDYYLTITESKKQDGDENGYYKKHKIYLYKEDFEYFRDMLDDVMNFIVRERGEEVISETHNPNYKKPEEGSASFEFEDL